MGYDSRKRRLRVAFVGGGQSSVIGGTHRLALRLSERFELIGLGSEPNQ